MLYSKTAKGAINATDLYSVPVHGNQKSVPETFQVVLPLELTEVLSYNHAQKSAWCFAPHHFPWQPDT